MSQRNMKRHLEENEVQSRRRHVKAKVDKEHDHTADRDLPSSSNITNGAEKMKICEASSSTVIALGTLLPGSVTAAAVINQQISSVSWPTYRGQWLCIVFYPMDFEPGLTRDVLRECSEKHAQFDALNCSVVYCSTDSCYAHLAWTRLSAEAGGLGRVHYPLLSDTDHSIARSFGLLDADRGVAQRAVVIVDPDQRVQQVLVTSTGIGGSVDSLLQSVLLLQRSAP